MIDWKEVYKLPFYNCQACQIHVKDTEHRICLNKVDDLATELVAKLNGYNDNKYDAHREGIWIYVNGRRVMMVRGWGRLTSVYGLDSKEAAEVQDAFADWIVEKLRS